MVERFGKRLTPSLERIFLRRFEILPKADLRLFSPWIYVVAIERR
jgi:hypothetical protein